MPVNASLAMQAAPRIKARAQNTEPTPMPTPAAAAPLVLPSPESLGLVPLAAAQPVHAASAEPDWNQVRSRLRQLGAISFHLDRVAGGNWRATLLVPQEGAAGPRHLEALGDSEGAALTSVLAQAESGAR